MAKRLSLLLRICHESRLHFYMVFFLFFLHIHHLNAQFLNICAVRFFSLKIVSFLDIFRVQWNFYSHGNVRLARIYIDSISAKEHHQQWSFNARTSYWWDRTALSERAFIYQKCILCTSNRMRSQLIHQIIDIFVVYGFWLGTLWAIFSVTLFACNIHMHTLVQTFQNLMNAYIVHSHTHMHAYSHIHDVFRCMMHHNQNWHVEYPTE